MVDDRNICCKISSDINIGDKNGGNNDRNLVIMKMIWLIWVKGIEEIIIK